MPRIPQILTGRADATGLRPQIIMDEVCPNCRGCGRIESPDWTAWWLAHNELPPEGDTLLLTPDAVACPLCDGDGWLLTPTGLKFLKAFAAQLLKPVVDQGSVHIKVMAKIDTDLCDILERIAINRVAETPTAPEEDDGH